MLKKLNKLLKKQKKKLNKLKKKFRFNPILASILHLLEKMEKQIQD